MHPSRNFGLLERIIIEETAVDKRFIVFCLNDHRWRNVFGHFNFRSQAEVFSIQISRINQQTVIRTTADLVGFIHYRITALVKSCRSHYGQMCTGRKAHHTNPVRINTIFFRMGTYITDGPLHILQRSFMLWPAFSARNPVFQQNGCNAQLVEPVANLGSFQIICQDIISTTRTNYHGRARSYIFFCRINRYFRTTDVCNPCYIYTSYLSARSITLLGQFHLLAGSAVRKQQDCLFLCQCYIQHKNTHYQ